MKPTLNFLIASLFLFNAFSAISPSYSQTASAVEIIYSGYERKVRAPDTPRLHFEIINRTKDTVFISRQKIVVTVIHKQDVLEEEPPSLGVPFIRPRNNKIIYCEEQQEHERQLEASKANFARKLFLKNRVANLALDAFQSHAESTITSDCLVLLPNETLDYTWIFGNSRFDKTSVVNVRYDERKSFSSVILDDAVVIEIFE